MDELPVVVLQEVIICLNLQERLKCKLISKKWKFAVETAAGPRSLCIYQSNFPCRVQWCFTGSEVIVEETVFLKPKEFHDFNTRINLFSNLRKLCLYRIEMYDFLNDLHLLKNLKILMIKDFYTYTYTRQLDEDSDYRINLTFESDSLEKLSFEPIKTLPLQSIESIDFNTPNLSSLSLWTNSNVETNLSIKFCSPLKLRHLECIEFDSNMSALTNLETLNCLKIVCPFRLENFASLQKLDLFPRQDDELDYIKGLIDQRKQLERTNLEIIVCGFKDLLIAYKPKYQLYARSFKLDKHFLSQIAKHPTKFVGRIPWEFKLDFPAFYETFEEIPKDLFCNHTPNIYSVSVWSENSTSEITLFHPAYVLELVTQSRPCSVTIFDYEFDKEFYQRLSSIQSIKELTVNTPSFEKSDYDCFLNLKNLRQFFIDTHQVPMDFILAIFKLKFMLEVMFYLKFATVGIHREKNCYCLEIAITEEEQNIF